ncbi:putative quinol monooxygenase [Streptococcus himalayensis]|uniref:Monooxygenase n=1 Tax=Streptococcus himalayensis TaxID=1888195 RepID=A0A917A8S8_9STRE|nr:putative quinol monooxygenase [Streptococcus himalayensis]GGE35941.1 monooxygenase [Streptococcus himalayensis]
MKITVLITYKGKGVAAQQFVREMEQTGIADRIRQEKGNLRYDYFRPFDDEESILLVDSWESQEALDTHHASPMMAEIIRLREKYDLHMTVERYRSDAVPDHDLDFIR